MDENFLISRSVSARSLVRLDFSSHLKFLDEFQRTKAPAHLLAIARDYEFLHNSLVRFPELITENRSIASRIFSASTEISKFLLRSLEEEKFFSLEPKEFEIIQAIAVRTLEKISKFQLKSFNEDNSMKISLSAKFEIFRLSERAEKILEKFREEKFSSSKFDSLALNPREIEFSSEKQFFETLKWKNKNEKRKNQKEKSEKKILVNVRHLPRILCEKCGKLGIFYCAECLAILQPILIERKIIPQIRLPIEIEILKHSNVKIRQSTAVQALILTGGESKISHLHQHPKIPKFDPETSICVFPSSSARLINEFSMEELKSIERVIFIEGTWSEAQLIARHSNLSKIKFLSLAPAESTIFWRFQTLGPKFLSTIEAIRQFFIEWNRIINKQADTSEFDNLLWIFALTFEKQREFFQSNPELLWPLTWDVFE